MVKNDNFSTKFFSDQSEKELKDIIDSQFLPLRELLSFYQCAMMEIETKFKVFNEEFSLETDRNPIESIKTRLKTPESIADKLRRHGVERTIENIEKIINDIAGIRVICSYVSDIYMLEEALLSQDDVKLIKRKDYIKYPKENGYRSLHLIIATTVYFHNSKRQVKVEIQFRTIPMDWWASLEHKIRYKKNLTPEQLESIADELLYCAKTAENLDMRMEKINAKINS